VFASDETASGIRYRAIANWAVLGKKLRKDLAKVKTALPEMPSDDIKGMSRPERSLLEGLNCIRTRTCSPVDRDIFVVWPRAHKSVNRKRWTVRLGNDEGGFTSSPIDVVQVRITVLAGTIASFTVEPGDSRPTSAGILHNHGLAKVLLQLERRIALFRQFSGLQEVVLLSPP
jgi:hypothetical protein